MGLFFASPWFLTGLLAAAIPILLLFIRAKTRERVVFSSVLFFKAITLTSNRRLEWKRLILLALRVSALVLLAAAFARPFRLGYEGRETESVKQLTFILDRSASMKMSEGGVTSWDRAKEAVRLQVKKHADAVFSLYVFDRKLSAAALHEKSPRRFLEKLETLQPGDSAGDFEMLGREIGSVCASEQGEGRCVVLSDFFADQELLDELARGTGTPVRAPLKAEWISVRGETFRNFFIRKLLLPPRPLIAGSEETIPFAYGSSGKFKSLKKVTLWINEKNAGQVNLDLAQSSSGEAAFKVAFADQGLVRLRIQAEADDFSPDDSWEETVWVGKPIEILLVTDHEAEHPFESPDFYLGQALLSVDAEEESRSWVRFYHKTAEELQTENLSTYDFVVFSEAAQLTAAIVDQAEAYLKAGGTAVYFAAPQSFSGKRRTMSPREEQFLKGRLQELEKAPAKAPVFLGPVDYDQPLFKAFESGRQGDLEQIRVHRFRPFLPDENSEQKILLRLGGRWPALTERTVQKGRLFVWTLGWTPFWSDLPKDPLFVPLVLEFLKYAGRQEGVVTRYAEAGQPLMITEARGEGLDRLEMAYPGGKSMRLYPDSTGLFTVEDTAEAGQYEWKDSKRLHQYIVTVPVSESEPVHFGTMKAGDESVKNSAVEAGLKETGSFLSPVFFYTACLACVFACLLMESFVAARLYQTEWV